MFLGHRLLWKICPKTDFTEDFGPTIGTKFLGILVLCGAIIVIGHRSFYELI